MGGFVGTMPGGSLNVALSNFAKEFRNNALIGEIFAPRVPVARQSFQYVVWNRDDMKLPGSTLRAPGDEPQTVRRSYSVSPYMARSHALQGDVPFESESYGLGLGFSTRKQLTQQLVKQINLDREVAIANLLLSSANYPNYIDLSSGSNNQWDVYPAVPDAGTDGSHPIKQVEAAKSVLRQAGVQDSDMVLALSDPVVVALQNHPDIVNRFKYTMPGSISLDQLSQVFRVKCIQGSAILLSKSNVPSWVWGSHAFLGYAQAAPTQDDVSCAKTFVWTGGTDGNGATIAAPPSTVDGYGVLEWLDPQLSKKKYWQSVDWYYDLRVTATETGIPLLNALKTAPVMGTIPGDSEG